jgi:hypothetical protein
MRFVPDGSLRKPPAHWEFCRKVGVPIGVTACARTSTHGFVFSTAIATWSANVFARAIGTSRAGLLIGGILARHAPQAGIKRTDLQQHDLSVPRREVIQTRVDIAPGAPFPRHKHPGDEIIYVIEGAIKYELDGRRP